MKERKPNRLPGYDYSRDNMYFVTTCVNHRICCLGDIKNGIMILNDYGKIVQEKWHWLGEQYPYILLHEFQVMPNHLHGIVEINRENILANQDVLIVPPRELTGHSVGTGRDLSLLNDLSIRNNLPIRGSEPTNIDNQPIKIKSLSELVGALKTTSSKKIHLNGYHEFAWQRSFHDYIIRDEQSYLKIAAYIINNPLKWEQDKFYKGDQ